RVPRVVSSLSLVLLVLGVTVGIAAAVATAALECAEKAPQGISRLLVGHSQSMRQVDKVSRSAEQVEKSVEGLSDNTEARPTTVVLQTESWRSQLMAKARDGVAGLALALPLTYF